MADANVSKRWNIETSAKYVVNVSVGNSGHCLVVTTQLKVLVYVTWTGLREHVEELLEDEEYNAQQFTWSALLDEILTILTTICVHTKLGFVNIVFGDPNCMLCITPRPGEDMPSTFMVLDLCRQVGRVLINTAKTEQPLEMPNYWYDSVRGLLFCADESTTGLLVLRVSTVLPTRKCVKLKPLINVLVHESSQQRIYIQKE